ncbi:MFS transporter [soil metagenome]
MFAWLNKNIVYLGLVSLFSDFGSEMATSVLPAFLVSLGASAWMLGLIEGLANASNSAISIVAGYASDYTQKRKPFAELGYLLASLGIGSLYFATSAIGLFAGRILTRIGKGVREPARDALLVSSATPKVYGRMFGFHRMMDNLGAVVGPLAALVLIKYVSLSVLFAIAFIPVFISFLIVIFFVKEAVIVNPIKHFKLNHLINFPAEFKRYISAVAVFSLGNCATSLLILRSIELLKPTLGAQWVDWYSILFYVIINVFYALFSYPVGVLADSVGKKKMLLFGYAGTAIALLGFAFSIHAIGYILALSILSGLAYAIVDGVQRALAADLIPAPIHASGYGFLAAIMGLGSLFSNLAVGFLWTYVSPAMGFGFAALVCAMGTALMAQVRK